MRAVLPVLLALLVAGSGCLSCTPLMEVRHCVEGQCVPSPDAVEVAWGEADAAAWPDVDGFLRDIPAGEHEHTDWTPERERAFWDHYGVTGDQPELIVHTDDGVFRVRVVSCG